jgi:hypothetical protein
VHGPVEAAAIVRGYEYGPGQHLAFVTFDHYIGVAPRVVTPSFASLAAPTIIYGQASVTLGGKITAGTSIPSGSVDITLAGQLLSTAGAGRGDPESQRRFAAVGDSHGR